MDIQTISISTNNIYFNFEKIYKYSSYESDNYVQKYLELQE